MCALAGQRIDVNGAIKALKGRKLPLRKLITTYKKYLKRREFLMAITSLNSQVVEDQEHLNKLHQTYPDSLQIIAISDGSMELSWYINKPWLETCEIINILKNRGALAYHQTSKRRIKT